MELLRDAHGQVGIAPAPDQADRKGARASSGTRAALAATAGMRSAVRERSGRSELRGPRNWPTKPGAKRSASARRPKKRRTCQAKSCRKRYTDLREGLPGIATDLLTARLRTLEAAGLVQRRTLPRPAPAPSTSSPSAAPSSAGSCRRSASWGSGSSAPRRPTRTCPRSASCSPCRPHFPRRTPRARRDLRAAARRRDVRGSGARRNRRDGTRQRPRVRPRAARRPSDARTAVARRADRRAGDGVRRAGGRGSPWGARALRGRLRMAIDFRP